MRIKIDGELYEVRRVFNGGYLPLVETESGEEFYVAEDGEHAGKAARRYWEELANSDPDEFTCLVGAETLTQWGLGRLAGPGSTLVRSLQEWLDLWLDTPEEQWASYDSDERRVQRSGKVRDELGFIPTVAYRHN